MGIRKMYGLLAMFLLAIFVRNVFGDAALDAKVNTISSWSTVPHVWGAGTFTISPIT